MFRKSFLLLPLLLMISSCATYEGRTANVRITTDPPSEDVPVYGFLLKEWNAREGKLTSAAGMEPQDLRSFLAGKTPIEKHVIKLGYEHVFYVDHNGVRGMVNFLPAKKQDLYEVVIPVTSLNTIN